MRVSIPRHQPVLAHAAPAYGIVPLIVAGVGGAVALTTTLIKTSADKRASRDALASQNPCYASLRGQVEDLKRTKPAGWKDRRKALEKEMKVHESDPHRCAAMTAASRPPPVAAVVAASLPPQQNPAAPPPPPAAPDYAMWVAGGIAVAALMVGTAAVVTSSSRK